ncbi:MAG: hypothetical protein U0694_09785 [Anaerolineae bacterium]
MPKKAAPVVEPVLDMEEKHDTPFTQFAEHQKKAISEAAKALVAMLPEGVREHGDKAMKEMVEGYRALFNSTLDEVVKTIEKARIEEKVVETVEKAKIREDVVNLN